METEKKEYSGVRFCDLCGNMLSPIVEDDGHGRMRLVYICKTTQDCNKKMEMDSGNFLISRKDFKVETIDNQSNEELARDPTLPRMFKRCTDPNCRGSEVVYKIEPSHKNDKIVIKYICTTCRQPLESKRLEDI